jgi:hypothetical protein
MMLLASLLAFAGMPVPTLAQWCDVVPDPFPPDPQTRFDAEALEVGVPVIDLLAMVIPEAGPLGEVRQHVQDAVDTLNQVLVNSQVPGMVRLIDVVPAPPSQPYRENDPDVLSDFANDPVVQGLRDALGADLVTLIVPEGMLPQFTSGTAYTARSASSGYSVLAIGWVFKDSTLLAHELGHNFGLPHNKENATNGGLYAPRAYGHWGQLPDGRWFQDVMTYGSVCPGGCTVPAYVYSNPEVTYLGAPMGVVGEREAALFLRSDAMQRVAEWRKTGECVPSDATLCLGHNRFRVEAAWKTSGGVQGTGHASVLTTDTGYFWFFDQGNIELIVKVLNGCGANARYWVFAAGLTNVEVTLTVTDTVAATTKTYVNSQGHAFQPIQDTSAFASCE